MHFSSQNGPGPPGSVLRSLRLSLNAPVVAISELPVGPAEALIGVIETADGAFSLTVAIRCKRTDEVAFFGPARPVEDPRASPHAAEAAISFAEGMGFLFDDDLFEGQADGSAEASSHWAVLVAGGGESLAVEKAREPLAVPEEDVALPPIDTHRVLTKFREPSGWLSAGIEAH